MTWWRYEVQRTVTIMGYNVNIYLNPTLSFPAAPLEGARHQGRGLPRPRDVVSRAAPGHVWRGGRASSAHARAARAVSAGKPLGAALRAGAAAGAAIGAARGRTGPSRTERCRA